VIFELRQYALKPGARDTLIELFDREFVESQEVLGSYIVGQFRDLDRPDYFVWVRGFADMPTRQQALTAFYGGPVWKASREAANATMIDTDDVYLLRGPEIRAPRVDVDVPTTTATVLIFGMPKPVDDDALDAATAALEPLTRLDGVRHYGTMRTEHAENNYPALPVRLGEEVVVSLLAFDPPADADRSGADPDGFAEALDGVTARLDVPMRRLRLQPTNRSRMR